MDMSINTPSNPAGQNARIMVFVSHANPEDNLFTRWLALRLAREGYPVWCDLTKLLGGEDFWRDIEIAIRDRTVKFLFVLSKTSNQKDGALMELAVARKVGKHIHDFIIPLRVDDIHHDNINIELQRLNCIDFSKGWTTGYGQLLEKLQKDGVARDPRFSPDAVTKWWRDNYSVTEGVLTTPERCASNWFEFSQLPKTLWLHSIDPPDKFEKDVKDDILKFPLPARPHGNCLFSFGKADELSAALGEHGLEIVHTQKSKFEAFSQDGLKHPKIERRDARKILSSMLRDGFQRFAVSKGLLPYELSGGAKFYWFKQGLVEDDKVFFTNSAGEKSWRQMVGYKSFSAKEGQTRYRNWHFGVQARPFFWPFTGFAVKAHVAFTENGVLYESKAKQHAARRSQCKSWYNDDWLARILATMSFLAGENSDEIQIPLSNDQQLRAKRIPMTFESPVSFQVKEQQQPVEEPEVDEEEAAEDEDEGDVEP
jgi:hypothetical protein